jgi:hypothetical protein
MEAIILTVIFLIISIIVFLNGMSIQQNSLFAQIYSNIQYSIGTVLFCTVAILSSISICIKKIKKVSNCLPSKDYVENNELRIAEMAGNITEIRKELKSIKDKVCTPTSQPKEEKQKIKCPKCNNMIIIEENFKNQFYCPHCASKLSFE